MKPLKLFLAIAMIGFMAVSCSDSDHENEGLITRSETEIDENDQVPPIGSFMIDLWNGELIIVSYNTQGVITGPIRTVSSLLNKTAYYDLSIFFPGDWHLIRDVYPSTTIYPDGLTLPDGITFAYIDDEGNPDYTKSDFCGYMQHNFRIGVEPNYTLKNKGFQINLNGYFEIIGTTINYSLFFNNPSLITLEKD